MSSQVGRHVTRAVGRVLETGRPELLEYRLDVPAGARWFQGQLAPIVDSASRTVCLLVRDITDQKVAEAARDDAERRLQHLAMYDALTDLPNRVFFRDRLDHAVKRTRRRDEELVVLVLDLDQFKDINDTFGHAAGDEVLREVARRLVVVTRDGDSIARLGGDEFAIVLPGASEEEGRRVAGRVTDGLKDPMVIGARAIIIDMSATCGVSSRWDRCGNQRADAAMYFAKQAHSMARRGAEG